MKAASRAPLNAPLSRTPLLRSALSPNDLPIAELWAARLDGELWSADGALHGSFALLDAPDTPAQRALSLAVVLPDRVIAERRSAAWIYGASDTAPSPHELCVDHSARLSNSRSIRPLPRDVVIGVDEVLTLGGMKVTSPVRTAIDIARIGDDFSADDAALVRRLAVIGGFGFDDCVVAVNARRNLPRKKLALERLARTFEVVISPA